MRLPPGLVFLDHTADVGIGIEAPCLHTFLHRAALGMLALLRGQEDEEPGWDEPSPDESGPVESGQDEPDRRAASERDPAEPLSASVELDAASPPSLLAEWLRELLFLHEVEHRDYVDADFHALEPTALRAQVRLEPAVGAVREIKGVTYHELRVERTGDRWKGQVIFDV